MKKMVLIGFVLAVAVSACGDASEEAVGGSPAPTTESESDAEPVGDTVPAPDPSASTNPSDDDPVLEVTPVDPDKGDVQPPPTTAGDDVVPIEVDHPNRQVATAIGDLAARFGIDVADVEVESAEEVTWPDGSIGCPLPGMQYTQALVNGTRIVLRADGVDYQYNSGGGRQPFYCANPSEPVAGGGDHSDS
jgi:hypothetical protein